MYIYTKFLRWAIGSNQMRQNQWFVKIVTWAISVVPYGFCLPTANSTKKFRKFKLLVPNF